MRVKIGWLAVFLWISAMPPVLGAAFVTIQTSSAPRQNVANPPSYPIQRTVIYNNRFRPARASYGRSTAPKSANRTVPGSVDSGARILLTQPSNGERIIPIAKMGPPKKPITINESNRVGSAVPVARVSFTKKDNDDE